MKQTAGRTFAVSRDNSSKQKSVGKFGIGVSTSDTRQVVAYERADVATVVDKIEKESSAADKAAIEADKAETDNNFASTAAENVATEADTLGTKEAGTEANEIS